MRKESKAGPFLKWAGGKTQLLPSLMDTMRPALEGKREITYVEPFIGSGAVLFEVLKTYPQMVSKVIINDINTDLVNVWKIVRDNPEALIAQLQRLRTEYLKLGDEQRKDYFLEIRKVFNQRNESLLKQASHLIFLNKTCFNGLYRVNRKNEFNVPHGRYSKPTVFDEEAIRAIAQLLQRVEIYNDDFMQLLQYAGKAKDVLWYFDPPYRPLSKSSSFIAYSADAFDDAQQIRLKDLCDEIHRRGQKFVLSNSDPKNTRPEDDFFEELFSNYTIDRVKARRSINSKGDKRGHLFELIIHNI